MLQPIKPFLRINIAAMLPILFMFIPFILFSSGGKTLEDSSAVALSSVHRVISLVLFFAFFGLYLLYRKRVCRIPELYGWFGVYLGVGTISALLFSNFKLYSFWKIFELISVYIFVFYVWDLSGKQFEIVYQFYKLVLAFLKLLLLSVILSAVVDPGGTFAEISAGGALFPYRVEGTIVVINSISIGTFSAFFVYNYIVRLIYGLKFGVLDFFLLPYFCILLVLSQSRTPVLGLIVTFLFFLFVTKRLKSSIKALSIVLFSSIAVLAMPFVLALLQRGATTEQLYHLTGRMVWWKYAIDKYMAAGIVEKAIGMGFTSAEREIASMASGGMMLTLDSTFFSLLVSVGAIGLTIITYLLVIILYRLLIMLRKYKYDYRFAHIFGVSMLIFIKAFTTLTVNLFSVYALLFLLSLLMVSRDVRFSSLKG